MDHYLYNVDLPFSGIQLSYREINSKEQLMLAKANILLPSSLENDLEYSKIVKKVLINCVENKEDFLKINLLDYILFILKLRIISLGETLELELQLNENENEKQNKIKITLDLNLFMRELYKAATESLKNNILEFNGLKITLSFPNIKSENNIINISDKKEIDHVLSTIPEYISKLETSDKKVDLTDLDSDKKFKVYERFPISVRTKIQLFVIDSIKKLSENNLFKVNKFDNFRFNFYNRSYLYLFRLMFSNNLRNIYQEYYILASKKIDPNYVDNLSIPERRVFCSFIEEEIKARKGDESSNVDIPTGHTSVEDLMDEFGG